MGIDDRSRPPLLLVSVMVALATGAWLLSRPAQGPDDPGTAAVLEPADMPQPAQEAAEAPQLPPHSLALRLVARDGSPIAAGSALLVQADGARELSGPASGVFEPVVVGAGELSLLVGAADHGPRSMRGLHVPPEGLELEVVLGPGRALIVEVRRADGEPVEAAGVVALQHVEGLPARPGLPPELYPLGQAEPVAGEPGHYHLQRMPQEGFQVLVVAGDHASLHGVDPEVQHLVLTLGDEGALEVGSAGLLLGDG